MSAANINCQRALRAPKIYSDIDGLIEPFGPTDHPLPDVE
jgi:hypothetical protein